VAGRAIIQVPATESRANVAGRAIIQVPATESRVNVAGRNFLRRQIVLLRKICVIMVNNITLDNHETNIDNTYSSTDLHPDSIGTEPYGPACPPARRTA